MSQVQGGLASQAPLGYRPDLNESAAVLYLSFIHAFNHLFYMIKESSPSANFDVP